MPTYQYRCTECGHDLEAVQKFSDAPLTECPACHGQLRKVYNAVGVVFKGSGFYRTDSRAANGSSDGGSRSGAGTNGETTTNGSSEKKVDSGSTSGTTTETAKTPAKAAAGSSTGSSSSS